MKFGPRVSTYCCRYCISCGVSGEVSMLKGTAGGGAIASAADAAGGGREPLGAALVVSTALGIEETGAVAARDGRIEAPGSEFAVPWAWRLVCAAGDGLAGAGVPTRSGEAGLPPLGFWEGEAEEFIFTVLMASRSWLVFIRKRACEK